MKSVTGLIDQSKLLKPLKYETIRNIIIKNTSGPDCLKF